MQSRRSAINESFRVTNAERALGPSGSGLGNVATPVPPNPTDTPAVSDTPAVVGTDTPTFTPSPTELPPFSCDNITVDNLLLSVERFTMRITNDNVEQTQLIHSVVHWNKNASAELALQPTYPNIHLFAKAIDFVPYWLASGGEDRNSPTHSFGEGEPQGAVFIEGQSEGLWEGRFGQAPRELWRYMSAHDFSGTLIRLSHPSPGPGEDPWCDVLLQVPPPPPPTPTPDGPTDVPSPTFTPDCASSNLEVFFDGFGSLGDIRLRVENHLPAGTVAPFTGFHIVFPTHKHPNLGLKSVVVGGINANDLRPSGDGELVWFNSSGGGQTTSPVDSDNAGQGTWVTDYLFPGQSVTIVHVDFTGVGGSRLDQLNPPIFSSDFNGTFLEIGCGSGGGQFGGPGSGPNGEIFISEEDTPTPAPPPTNTNTPGPTWTPTLSPTPGPPTNTWTPRPPTDIPTDAPTSGPTNTLAPSPTFTPIDSARWG